MTPHRENAGQPAVYKTLRINFRWRPFWAAPFFSILRPPYATTMALSAR